MHEVAIFEPIGEADLADPAWLRADAWARSVVGTPYGVLEPVTAVARSGRAPDPLDQRVMARLLGTGEANP